MTPSISSTPAKDEVERDALKPFPMLSGTPSIPYATARIVYAAYHAQYPGQSFERIAERGGFGWAEVGLLFKELQRRNPRLHKELIAQSRATLSPVNGEVERLQYHAEQLATYIAQPFASEKDLASARYHNDAIRAALASPETQTEGSAK